MHSCACGLACIFAKIVKKTVKNNLLQTETKTTRHHFKYVQPDCPKTPDILSDALLTDILKPEILQHFANSNQFQRGFSTIIVRVHSLQIHIAQYVIAIKYIYSDVSL